MQQITECTVLEIRGCNQKVPVRHKLTAGVTKDDLDQTTMQWNPAKSMQLTLFFFLYSAENRRCLLRTTSIDETCKKLLVHLFWGQLTDKQFFIIWCSCLWAAAHVVHIRNRHCFITKQLDKNFSLRICKKTPTAVTSAKWASLLLFSFF